MDFAKAQEKLGNRQSRKIGNNTYLQKRDGGDIAVKLHQTDVVTFKPNGDTVLDSGGWLTVTTKARMNEHAPCFVYSNKGVWFISLVAPYHAQDNEVFPYADGITIHADRTVTGEGADPKATNKLRAKCRKYAADFVAALVAGKVPAPSGGDCWFCCLRGVEDHKPMGEAFKDAEHIREHIRERYYVPSLLVNAFEMFGASQAMKGAVAELWYPEQLNGAEPYWSKQTYMLQQIRKVVSRYTMRQLGLAA